MNDQINTPPVPYIVYDEEQARNERNIKRLVIALIISICLIFATNALWLWYMCGFDIETYDYTQDGRGVNIIGNSNGVDYNGSTISSAENGAEENSEEKIG